MRDFSRLLASALCVICALFSPARALDWPTGGYDNRRTGITAERLPANLGEAWVLVSPRPPARAWSDPSTRPIEGVLELPRMRFDDAFGIAAAGGRVFMTSSAENKVYALDAKSGRILWSVYADAAVRLAPTVWDNRVYFGSDDGKAYCVDASDGRVVWTYSAALSPQRILGQGRMLSPWPIRTGVAVEDGVAYFAAGLFPAEGIFLYAVDARTGKLLWVNDNFHQGEISPQGQLVVSSDRIYLPSGRSMPAAFNREDGKFVFQKGQNWRTIGLSGGSEPILAEDLLVCGTEQIVCVDPKDGKLLLAEAVPATQDSTGVHRVTLKDGTLYVLTGREAQALDRAAWTAHSKKLLDIAKRVSKIAQQDDALRQAPNPKSPEVVSAREQLRKEKAQLMADREAIEKANNDGRIRWRVPLAASDSLAIAGDTLLAGGDGQVFALDLATGKTRWSVKVDGKARGLAIADGRLLVSTDRGTIHSFAANVTGPAQRISPQQPMRTAGEAASRAALRIVSAANVQRGYALVLGGSADLAMELASRTELTIHVLEPDAARVANARETISANGLYGSRIVVDHAASAVPPYADYFANLIVVADAPGATPQDVLRMLKPCGGVAVIGIGEAAKRPAWVGEWVAGFRKASEAAGDVGTKIQEAAGAAHIQRGSLKGAGSWTHEYADASNTACGDDRIVKAPLGVLWFGEPGPSKVINRHVSGASPLALHGRMYVQGEHTVHAYDAYNGLFLWERSIPGFLRFGLKTKCANWAANDAGVFVAVKDGCIRLDLATGQTLKTYAVPAGKDGKTQAWEYIAVVGKTLYGSGGTQSLFAYDIETGNLRWRYDGGNIQTITICLGDSRLFFVDTNVPKEQADAVMATVPAEARIDGDGKPIKPDVRRAVCLDANTGTPLWQTPLYVGDCVKVGIGGGELVAQYSQNILLICGQPWNGHFWKEFLAGKFTRRGIIALQANDGKMLWSASKGYRSRPLIVGDRIYAEPWCHDLRTGTPIRRPNPLTGADALWQMTRPGHHCGNIAACASTLFFRSASMAYYDLLTDSGTIHFGGQRTGCWINVVPANGLVMMPEGSSGCVCPFPLQTTIVFAPRTANRAWTMYSTSGPLKPIKRLAVNFGAPGDRQDSSGALWLNYPRVKNERLGIELPLEVKFGNNGRYFQRSTDTLRIDNTQDPWLYTAGMLGMSCCVLPLNERGAAAELYTVRLHFAEIEGKQPGQRVFNVSLQGKPVLTDFDIAKEAGGMNRAIVREIKGVSAGETLTITMNSKNPEMLPLLSAVEVHREERVAAGN